MRIDHSPLSGSPVDRQALAAIPAPLGRLAGIPARYSAADSGELDFSRLVAAVRGTDEVRADLLAEVSRRLAAGEYDTQAAAERTAEAILGSAP